jgi:hypothetical protein
VENLSIGISKHIVPVPTPTSFRAEHIQAHIVQNRFMGQSNNRLQLTAGLVSDLLSLCFSLRSTELRHLAIRRNAQLSDISEQT